MTRKRDDPEGRKAARELYERIRGAREGARKGAPIVDIQKSVIDEIADTSKPVKRIVEPVKEEGKAAGADLHQVGRFASRSLRAIGARVRQNRHRFN